MKQTWRRRSGLATWTFSVPARPGESSQACLRRSLQVALGALEGFARVQHATVSTRALREVGVVHDGATPLASALTEILDGADPVSEVALCLDLRVALAVDGAEQWLPGDGWLTFERDEHSADGSIALRLTLDVDIYAERTLGASTENSALARRHAPRLAGFLRTVRATLKAHLDALDADGYAGQAGPDGFSIT